MSDSLQIQQALSTMYSNANADVKKQATTFLEQFQKSLHAWATSHDLLASESSLELKIFAAQTLRSKVTYDLSQLEDNPETLNNLKTSLIQLICKYNSSSQDRLVRTQLCIALAQLALQLISWTNAMDEILLVFSNDHYVLCLLEFLKVLPEELSDVKKTSLTDDEFNSRTQELITQKVEPVILLLSNLTDANKEEYNSAILDCLNSWIKECPIEEILKVTSLTNLIFNSLSNDDSFDKSIECLCTIMRETRDIDNYQLIDALYQKVLELNTYMTQSGKIDDLDTFTGLTRLYVEAGESWHVLIAKNPLHFKPLVEILLQCCKHEEDLDVIKYTFYFWYLLKQLVTLPKFQDSKAQFQDVYGALVEIIIKHLMYPVTDKDDLFDGDKEQEDKFKDFRYEMGDVLKDCCAVVGPTKALGVPFRQIQEYIQSNNAQWQYIEAPLFSMRAMAKEVSVKEKNMLPSIMQFLVQLPEHPKVRYAATLVLGRYTEWTANNPDFLQPQLNYIIKGFELAGDSTQDKDTIIAASHALMYFCQDCSTLLVNYLEQLYMLYAQVSNQLELDALYKLVDGLAHVLLKLPQQNMYKTTEMFLQPTLDKINKLIHENGPEEELGDQIEVLTTFIGILKCKNYDQPNFPICDLFIDKVWPLVPAILHKYGSSLRVSEKALKLIKSAVQSFLTYTNPILGELVNLLYEGFKQSKFGCYLWVSGVVIREFADEFSAENVKQEIYKFGMEQSQLFFQLINSSSVNVKEMPDVVEDFFRMLNDLLMFFPFQFIQEPDMLNSVKITSLFIINSIEEFEPLVSIIHFLIDLVSWGFPYPPISFFEDNPKHIQETVKQFLVNNNNGREIIIVLLNGLIFKFHSDLHQDANDLLLKVLTLVPIPVALEWLHGTVSELPNVSNKEIEKLISTVKVALPNKDNRRVRSALKDFLNWYTRKNVSRLE